MYTEYIYAYVYVCIYIYINGEIAENYWWIIAFVIVFFPLFLVNKDMNQVDATFPWPPAICEVFRRLNWPAGWHEYPEEASRAYHWEPDHDNFTGASLMCSVKVEPGAKCAVPILTYPGWWFGTFFIFPYIGKNHPNWLIFFRRGWNHQPVAYCCLQFSSRTDIEVTMTSL